MKIKTPLLLTALGAGMLSAGAAQATDIAAILRPGDGLGGLNLISYTNPIQGDGVSDFNSAWVNSSTGGPTGDAFNIMDRDLSVFEDIINQVFQSTLPFALVDDSPSLPNPPDQDFEDTQGFIAETDFDEFFGVSDTENPDNSGPVTATWEFDISSAISDVEITLDLAAMGDFEATSGTPDTFAFAASIDGGLNFTTLGAFSVDEDGMRTYTMDDGNTVELNDPLLFNGTVLTEDFANFSLGTIAGSASATSLILTFDAVTDGGAEALAFRNLLISEAGGTVLPGDTDGDGDVDNSDLQTAIANFTGPQTDPPTFTKTLADGDNNADGAVSNVDLQAAIANFTGPNPAAVPEPASLALLGLGGLLIARRRRA